MTAARQEVLCSSRSGWIARLMMRGAVRMLMVFAYSWPVAGAVEGCERSLDSLVARPVWWRTRARALVAELLSSPA